MAIQTELVGHIDCPVCSQQGQKKRAEVRKGKRKMIIDCPVHSTLSMQGGTGQKFIRENMVKISEKTAQALVTVRGLWKMTNQVDVSQETVASDWERILREHEAVPPEPDQKAGQGGQGPALDFGGIEGVEVEGEHLPGKPAEAGFAEKVEMAKKVIASALVMVFDALAGFDIPEDKYDAMAQAWAVVIVKRFPGGIFEFLGKYKDEVMAVWASVIFIKAVRVAAEAKAKKQEEERLAKAQKKHDSKQQGDSNGTGGTATASTTAS